MVALHLSACAKSVTPDAGASQSSPKKIPSAVASHQGASDAADDALEPLPELSEGCSSNVERDGGALERLASLATQCIAGMRPLAPPQKTTLRTGASRTFEFEITEPSRCLRLAAAGGPGVLELDLSVIDVDGRPQRSRTGASLALVLPRGPLCFKAAGRQQAVVTVRRGTGEVAFQVWQAE
jgi:hypothetical protein